MQTLKIPLFNYIKAYLKKKMVQGLKKTKFPFAVGQGLLLLVALLAAALSINQSDFINMHSQN